MCIRVLLFLINTEGGMWDKNKYSTGCFNAQRNQLIYQHQAGKKDKQQGCVANWAK